MIHKNYQLDDGFTAVELLITLFVASIFLFAGYQLYTQVSFDGIETEKMAKLSNITYERVQQAGVAATTNNPYGCKSTSLSTVGPNSEQISGIGTVRFTTVTSCPSGVDSSANLFLVKVTASYTSNGADKQVQHALYAN